MCGETLARKGEEAAAPAMEDGSLNLGCAGRSSGILAKQNNRFLRMGAGAASSPPVLREDLPSGSGRVMARAPDWTGGTPAAPGRRWWEAVRVASL